MTIDKGNHPSIAKKPHTFALKHYDWVKEQIDKLLEAGVIRQEPFKLVSSHYSCT